MNGTHLPSAQPPDGLPTYRLPTGPDDAAFCRRVSEAIALGYVLYGSPSATFNGERVIVAQAIVWPPILASLDIARSVEFASLGAMELRRVRPEEVQSVHELLVASGWKDRVGDLHQFAALVEASQIAEVAVIENCVVGFARGITDSQSNGYLSMVVVTEAHRGKGIGRRLVGQATGSNPNVTWVLRAGREGASEFFAKLGFEQSSIAMERRRAQSAWL
jgi:GNAT superfamily N-acetyltransferase